MESLSGHLVHRAHFKYRITVVQGREGLLFLVLGSILVSQSMDRGDVEATR